ncbi:cyclase family protein, partial [Xenorhabdus bovienii]
CGEHTGTHFDAPIHWVSGKDHRDNTVDTIPLDNFVAPAVVVDASQQVAQDPDWLLTVEFLQEWEAQYGRIPAGGWLLFRTDWSKR